MIEIDDTKFRRTHLEIQRAFEEGMTEAPAFAAPKHEWYYEYIVRCIRMAARKYKAELCPRDEGIQEEDVFGVIHTEWYLREAGHTFINSRTGEPYRKKKYDPGEKLSFKNWLFIVGRAAVQRHLTEDGYREQARRAGEGGTRVRNGYECVRATNETQLLESRTEEKARNVFGDAVSASLENEPEAALGRAELVEEIRGCIDRLEGLSDAQKAFVELRIFEGYSVDECIEILRLEESRQNLRALYDRARREIQRHLEKNGYDRNPFGEGR